MKRFLLYIFIFFISLTYCSRHGKISKDAGMERIISLSPHITEIFYAMHLEKKLIAITDFCNYPPEAQSKEKVGGLYNPNMEKIITLKPDILIGTPASADLAAKLEKHDLTIIMIPNDTIEDIYLTIDSIGTLTGYKNRADSLRQLIQDSLAYYHKKAAEIQTQKPTAMFVLGRDAGTIRNISIIGPDTFTEEIWQLVGGENTFSDLPIKFAQVNREAVITRKPDIIIEFKFNEEWDEQKDKQNLQEWQELATLPAVSTGDIYVLTGNYTLIPGPRLYLLAKDYYKIIKQYNKNMRF